MMGAALPLEPDPVWGLGLGFAVFVIAAGAVWGSVHLREKAYDTWSLKVDLAFTGLQERAIEIFEELRNAIDEVIPPATSRFDPMTLVADPAPVGKIANRAVKVLKGRMRIHRQFSILLALCTVAKWLSFIFAAATLTSTLLYFFMYPNTFLWQSSSWLTGLIFVAGVIVVIGYAVTEGRLQRSYENSGSILGKEGT